MLFTNRVRRIGAVKNVSPRKRMSQDDYMDNTTSNALAQCPTDSFRYELCTYDLVSTQNSKDPLQVEVWLCRISRCQEGKVRSPPWTMSCIDILCKCIL